MRILPFAMGNLVGAAGLLLVRTGTAQEVVGGPPGAVAAGMAFDAARAQAILFGGRPSNALLMATDRTFAWNGTAWRERLPANHPSARSAHCMAYDSARQRVVLFGGAGANGAVLADTWEWDGSNWNQIAVTGPVARWRSAMTFFGAANRILMFGGNATSDWLTAQLRDLWTYDGAQWQPIALPQWPNGPFERSGHSLVYDDARQTVILYGGASYNHLPDGVVWEFGAGGLVAIPSSGPTPREGAMLLDVPGPDVVLHGGAVYLGNNRPLPTDTWRWNGSAWSPVAGQQPTAEKDATGCFDSVRGEAVLWGGREGQFFARAETWTFQSAWTQRTVVPTLYDSGALCFDAAHGQMLLQRHNYSGFGPGAASTTWVDGGAGWTLLSPANQPPARIADHDLACDRQRQVCVLFSGRTLGSATMPADTWEWNGTNWLLANPTVSPPAREGHGLAYDRARGRVVLFGGVVFVGSSLLHLADTWEYDGTTWQHILPSAAPSPRNAIGAMAYDQRSRSIVLGGGFDLPSQSSSTDTWQWNGAQWTLLPGTVPAGARLYEDDDIGRAAAVAPNGSQLVPFAFDGNGWRAMVALPGQLRLAAFDGGRGTLRALLDGETDVVVPQRVITDPGDPIALTCTGRAAIGNQLTLALPAPGAFVIAIGTAVVPGVALPGAPWCAGGVAYLSPAAPSTLSFGTTLNVQIPTSTSLVDLPACIQGAMPTAGCLAVSNAWVFRIQS